MTGATVADVVSSVEAAVERLAAADPRLLAAAVAFQLSIFAFRAIAWRNVLAAAYPDERVSHLGVGAAYAVGVGLNGVLPARGGDAAKIALVRLQVPRSSVATIVATGAVILLVDALLGALLVTATAATGHAAPVSIPPLLADVVRTLAGHPLATVVAGAPLLLLAGYLGRRRAGRVRTAAVRLRQGLAILETPGRYVRAVLAPQLAAWLCRIGVVLCVLAAFGMPATVPVAVLVIVLGAVSTAVPGAPGGLGTQQLLLVYALGEVASGTTVVAFSLGMQAGVTLVNATVGLTAAMLVLRTRSPIEAMRGLRRGG